jgi:tRNA(Ile2) C34 agmatinyltransferase TiaS
MDPVSSVSIAAAVVQFLDAGLKLLTICREIRDDLGSSTERNRELEEAARLLKGSMQEIERAQTSRVPRRILAMAKSCAGTNDELIKVLDYVKGAGKHITTARAALRVMRERKTIEKLQNTLRSKQSVLEQLLIQDIW